MTQTLDQFNALLAAHGSDVVFHRVDSMIQCPCVTPEGYRDLEWHLQHRSAPMCNAEGMLPDPSNTVDMIVKAFVQPVVAARGTRLQVEQIQVLFGEIQADDHIGIFPESWNATALNFYDWGRSGEDYIVFAGQNFICVNANLVPDPEDGNPRHHWECGLRLIDATDVVLT